MTTATNVRRGAAEGFCIFCRRRVVNHVAVVKWAPSRVASREVLAAGMCADGTYYLCTKAPGVCAGAAAAIEEGRSPEPFGCPA